MIGTGASAIQFVPEVAQVAGSTTIYQRSAPWILPKTDRSYPSWERRLFRRFPARVAAAALGMFAFFEIGTYGLHRPPRGARRRSGRSPTASAARSSATTRSCSPGRRPTTRSAASACSSPSDWYPTLLRDDVELVTGAVQRVTRDAVVGGDGVERPTDTIIYGTGFETHNFVAPMEVHGLDGKELNAVWGERAEAYLGTTVSGFPNMFVLYGPNTNHGSGSVPYTLESQFNYVIDAIRRLRDGGYPLDRPATRDPGARGGRRWRERSADTVWTTGGCDNWYLNAQRREHQQLARRLARVPPAHPPASTRATTASPSEGWRAAATFVFFPRGRSGRPTTASGSATCCAARGHRVVFIAEESFAGTLEAKGFEERLMRLTPPPETEEDAGPVLEGLHPRHRARSSASRRSSSSRGSSRPTFEALVDGARYVDERLRRDHRRGASRT